MPIEGQRAHSQTVLPDNDNGAIAKRVGVIAHRGYEDRRELWWSISRLQPEVQDGWPVAVRRCEHASEVAVHRHEDAFVLYRCGQHPLIRCIREAEVADMDGINVVAVEDSDEPPRDVVVE